MSHDADKEFDGIRQADNKLPLWYTVSFIGTLIIGLVYLLYYHVFTDWSQASQYAEQVAHHEEQFPGGSPVESGVVGNPFRGDAAAIQAGQETFVAVCGACHKADGTGLVGPNLTDEQWLHGNSEQEVYTVIMEGLLQPDQWLQQPAKGPMPAHKASLGSTRVWQVIAYLEDHNQNIEVPASTE